MVGTVSEPRAGSQCHAGPWPDGHCRDVCCSLRYRWSRGIFGCNYSSWRPGNRKSNLIKTESRKAFTTLEILVFS